MYLLARGRQKGGGFCMNKLLSKLKGNLEKANEVLEESHKIVSNGGGVVNNTKEVGGDSTKQKVGEKVEGQEKTTDI